MDERSWCDQTLISRDDLKHESRMRFSNFESFGGSAQKINDLKGGKDFRRLKHHSIWNKRITITIDA